MTALRGEVTRKDFEEAVRRASGSGNMNQKPMIFLAGLLIAITLLQVDTALPQQQTQLGNVAVVDVGAVMQNSDALKSATSQIDTIRASYERELKSEGDDLALFAKSIEQLRPKLSPGDYQRQTQKYAESTATYQRHVQEQRKKLADASSIASQKIAAAIFLDVNQIKKERKLAVILNRSAIVGTSDLQDITQDVLARLNRQMPSVPIPTPK